MQQPSDHRAGGIDGCAGEVFFAAAQSVIPHTPPLPVPDTSKGDVDAVQAGDDTEQGVERPAQVFLVILDERVVVTIGPRHRNPSAVVKRGAVEVGA